MILNQEWHRNEYDQLVCSQGKFTGYVENTGHWFVHFTHSDGNPRTVSKGYCYLGVKRAQSTIERELNNITQAIAKGMSQRD